FIDEHALTVNINRLRSKIESKDDGVKYIKTIYGIGYMWIGEDA
ncbi:MAG: winged helix-turn-helix domain-containing protein, partial [Clostridium sp.]|nr:winged helix-turn-helix domain-containing protein [Clostridium sp.]